MDELEKNTPEPKGYVLGDQKRVSEMLAVTNDLLESRRIGSRMAGLRATRE